MRTPPRALVGVVPLALLAASSSVRAQPTSTEMVMMRDNVGLATDLYLPAGTGPWPVVLHRTPYNKASFADAAHNLQGLNIAAVAQDMRGRFASEGKDGIFLCEGDGALKDGYDTIQWIAQQPFFNGKLLTFGGSATGIVQYMAASAGPPALTAMWVEVATPMVYDHLVFQGGVFRKEMIEGWLDAQNSEFFLQDIAAHPLADAFWAPGQSLSKISSVNVPAVHWGGWYDILTQGTLDAFSAYQHQAGTGAQGKQKLVMGPWTHAGNGGVQQGELTYPDNAKEPPGGKDDLLITWLAHYLAIAPDQAAIDAIPAVQYYVMGDTTQSGAPGNVWRSANDWPIAAAPIRMHLHPGNLLSESCPPAGDLSETYLFDPADPSPTNGGGNLVIPAGPRDQSAAEQRSDILVFSTPELPEPVEITGRIQAHLWVSTDTVDTDLAVRLTDVHPDNRSILVQDGIVRLATRGANDSLQPLTPGEIVEAVVDLWSTSIIVNAGHRIRVSITSSNFPRFRANPNDGTSYGAAATTKPANVTLYHSLDRPSYIELPNPQRASSEVTLCGDAGAGGSAGAAGAAGSGAGGGGAAPSDAGTDASAPGEPSAPASDSGCGCRTASSPARPWAALLAAACGWVAARRRARKSERA